MPSPNGSGGDIEGFCKVLLETLGLVGIKGSTNSQKASEISQVFFLGIASYVSGCLLRLSTRIDQKEKIANLLFADKFLGSALVGLMDREIKSWISACGYKSSPL